MIRAFETVRSLFLWAVAFPVFILCCLAVLLTALVYRGPKLEPFIKFCCRTILLFAGVRVREHGLEHCEPGRRYILMMNHVNFLDPMVFYARFPGRARGIEEESHFRWPVYGAMLRRIGTLPVDRKNPRKAKASLTRAAEFIRARKDFSFLVLPEGTRTTDGKLGPFKRGGFLLAREAGLEILPIIQVGAYRINHKGSRLIRPGRIEYIIEAPISAPGDSKEDLAVWMERVRAVFLKYLDGDL
jgi:1-acyl-sn-glycerol-3-phosphate acyltransferase